MEQGSPPVVLGLSEGLGPLPEARKPDENGAGWFTVGQMHAYALQERAAERERCAKVCDDARAAILEYHDKRVRDAAETVCINLAVRIRGPHQKISRA